MNILTIIYIILLLYVLNINNLLLTLDLNILMFAISIGTMFYLLMRSDPMILCHVSGVIYVTYVLMVNYYKQQ